jgi:AcrR family transcriptional regulator
MPSRRKAGTPVVTREQIVATADALAKADGIASVTVRRVSAALSVTAPALYWHLEGKSELMSQLVDRIAARVQHPAPSAGSWLHRLVEHYASVRDVFGEYPGISGVLMTTEPGDATAANCVFVVEVLVDAGFDQSAAASLFTSLSTLATGHLMMNDAARHQRGSVNNPRYAPNAARLAELLAQRPDLMEFQRSLVELDDATSRTRFLRGVELLIRGAATAAGVKAPAVAAAVTPRPPRGVGASRRRTA